MFQGFSFTKFEHAIECLQEFNVKLNPKLKEK